MASKTALPSAVLALRLLALVLLAASLALIAADKLTIDFTDGEAPERYTFKDVYAYRYLLAVAVVGCAYTLLQLPFAAVSIARRKRVIGGSEGPALLLVSADVVFALLVATGGAAGLGVTYDANRSVDQQWFDDADARRSLATIVGDVDKVHRDVERFFALAYASSGLMLGAAACMALMIMISTYALVK